jgi:hypothetical protein
MGCKNIYINYKTNRLRRTVRNSTQSTSSNIISTNDPPVYNMLDHDSYRNTTPVVDYENSKNESKPSDLPTYDQVVISIKTKTAKYKSSQN